MHLVRMASRPVKNGPDPVKNLEDMVQFWVSNDEIQVHHPPRAVDERDPTFRLRHENLRP